MTQRTSVHPRAVLAGAALLALAPAALAAQAGPPRADARPAARALVQWIGLDAPPGDERLAGARIRRADRRWTEDAQGNLVRRVGSGRPRRVLACGIDHPGYVVSEITDAGYLRLHRAGNAPVHPLWDQAHQGQQVEVRTARGRVPGVVAIPNGHFARQHRGDTAVVGVDQLWVDVGARSRADVAALGVALIDPVRRDVPPWAYADHVAGPDASGRAGCAALAAVANAPPSPRPGETVFVISTLRSFGWAGLAGALARIGPVDELALVAPASPGASDAAPVARRRAASPPAVVAAGGRDSVTMLSVRARWPGALVESVRDGDADALRRAVADLAGADAARAAWLALDPAPAVPAPARDSLSALAETLRRLADLPGVPGHEFRVRAAVRAALPAWARDRAVADSAGNLFVVVGPARDTTVVVAHMDEVAYVVSGIRDDGTVTLDARGGVIPSAWEGQPALLHFDAGERGAAPPSLPGVFAVRDSAGGRAPPSVTAWFGIDSAALVGRGVRVGQGVTAYKRAQRLGPTRFTGRALDDRAGSAALLLALSRVDTTRLDHAVVFAWAAYEEGGLVGSRALARRLAASVRRVYAVDTFVSSDTPLERPTFAYAPLGAGPVLRALDDGAVSSRGERDRVTRAAREARVTLQVGTTHGSTDATSFVRWGAVGAGLSWPGRYSHSPAEVLDLRDLGALARLILAAASAPTR